MKVVEGGRISSGGIDYLVVSGEYCPEAVVEWYKFGLDKGPFKEYSELRSKARKHLSALGWCFWYKNKNNRLELRYTSPSGKSFSSLRTACKACIDGLGGGPSESDVVSNTPANVISASRDNNFNNPTNYIYPEGHHRDQVGLDQSTSTTTTTCLFPGKMGFIDQESLTPPPLTALSVKPSAESSSSCSLTPPGFSSSQTRKRGKRKNSTSPNEPKGHDHAGSSSLVDSDVHQSEARKPRCKKSIRGKVISDLKKLGSSLSSSSGSSEDHHHDDVINSRKKSKVRVRKVVPNRNPRTVLACLIDNNVVLAGAKVHYRGKNDSGGEITRNGIKCHCCSKLFALTAFEIHVGSTNHRPAANILLEDGRSLVDCQRQVNNTNKNNIEKIKGDIDDPKVINRDENDDVCAVCHYGGELVLCDRCPSAYHVGCLGLESAPTGGDWFCPPCSCGVCGSGKFEQGEEAFVCYQCERKFHVGCLRNNSEGFSRESMFCGGNCGKVCLGIGKILGKRIPVGDNNGDHLTWTLLKSSTNSAAFRVDYSSKLGLALAAMHECFEPAKDPLTKRDIVEDVLYSRESELSRMNFRGFYTVVLERNDDLVSVATVRIFGDKLAEVPLVATRFQYRRLGMCRILMRELEKQLVGLGVERMTLPAASGVVQTWTSSCFGFEEMTADEKLKLLSYNLLDFQDTIMCQKLLKKTSLEQSRPLMILNPVTHDSDDYIPCAEGQAGIMNQTIVDVGAEILDYSVQAEEYLSST